MQPCACQVVARDGDAISLQAQNVAGDSVVVTLDQNAVVLEVLDYQAADL